MKIIVNTEAADRIGAEMARQPAKRYGAQVALMLPAADQARLEQGGGSPGLKEDNAIPVEECARLILQGMVGRQSVGLHGAEPPSEWVKRWSHLVKPQGRVLDVACGHGRHATYFYEQNNPVALVDIDQAAIESIALEGNACEKVVADIENGPWPFAGMQFDAVLVTNYLWRPLMPTLLASLAPGDVMIYETFAQGNETVGKPSRPDFLLRTAELLNLCRSLRVVAFEDGFLPAASGMSARFVQRIVALREVSVPLTSSEPKRYPLARFDAECVGATG
jgi:SAM-dependent methyltransferase